MSLHELQRLLGPKEPELRPQIDLEDPIIHRATMECCAYVCDVMQRIGIRDFDPNIARSIAQELLRSLEDDEAHWSSYLNGQAVKINEEALALLNNVGRGR